MSKITYVNGVEYKDEAQYNASMDVALMNSKIRKLNKRIDSGKKTTNLMQKFMICLFFIIIGLIVIGVIQNTRYNNINAKYNTLKEQYEDMRKDYVAMAVDYAGLKSDLEQYKQDAESAAMSSEIAMQTLTNISTQYSAYPGFVYNEAIPLDKDIQQYAFQKCAENGINYQIFLGLMRAESGFNPTTKSKTGDYGLCQINKVNHAAMKKIFGSNWDWSNPYDSIDASTYMLGSLVPNYSNWHYVLMAYNAGPAGAKKNYFNKGVYSTDYSKSVIGYAIEYGYSGDGSY